MSREVTFLGGGPWMGQCKRLGPYPNGYMLKVVMAPAEPITLATGSTILPQKVNYRVGHYEILYHRDSMMWFGVWRGIQN